MNLLRGIPPESKGREVEPQYIPADMPEQMDLNQEG